MQIRTSINQHVTKSKEFSWIRHIVITVALLAGTNTLVILVPTIRDIFGFVGRCLPVCVCVCVNANDRLSVVANVPPVSTGASAAAMLIFILPSAFYLKLVKKESMKSMQKIGVRTALLHRLTLRRHWALTAVNQTKNKQRIKKSHNLYLHYVNK